MDRPGFALGIERVEGLVQALIRRFARINRTADALRGPGCRLVGFSHCGPRCYGPRRWSPKRQRNEDLTSVLQ
jgi:hypothetical protein